MRVLAVLTLLLSLTSNSFAGADKAAGGFAAHVGFGALYGGQVGAAVEYQFLLKPRFRLTPYLSGGAAFNLGASETFVEFGYSAGILAEFGARHRLAAGAGFGTLGVAAEEDSAGNITELGVPLGPSIIVGYRGTMKSGFLIFPYGGLEAIVNLDEPGVWPLFGIGIGWKF